MLQFCHFSEKFGVILNQNMRQDGGGEKYREKRSLVHVQWPGKYDRLTQTMKNQRLVARGQRHPSWPVSPSGAGWLSSVPSSSLQTFTAASRWPQMEAWKLLRVHVCQRRKENDITIPPQQGWWPEGGWGGGWAEDSGQEESISCGEGGETSQSLILSDSHSGCLTSCKWYLTLEDDERAAPTCPQQTSAEAEARLRSGVGVGRSWGNTRQRGEPILGLLESPQMEKGGWGLSLEWVTKPWGGGNSALPHSSESGEEDGSRMGMTSLFLPAEVCDRAFPLFSRPSVHSSAAPFLPLKTRSELEHLKLFQNIPSNCGTKTSFTEEKQMKERCKK